MLKANTSSAPQLGAFYQNVSVGRNWRLCTGAPAFQTSGALIMSSLPMIFHLNEDQETNTETQHTVVSGHAWSGRGGGGACIGSNA